MWYIQLRNYAEWYYTKYFPSRNMLLEKLSARSEEREVVERVMADLASLIVEENVIESRIHGYLSQGKTARYIRWKLLQKKFDSALIDNLLLQKNETLKNPETYRAQIEKRIQQWEKKWFSKKALRYELQMHYPDARELIDSLLLEYDDRQILQKKAPELLKKYSQEQAVSRLAQKGFTFSDIYTVFRRR
jgi:SOS response regulatory protein OraA/RecX